MANRGYPNSRAPPYYYYASDGQPYYSPQPYYPPNYSPTGYLWQGANYQMRNPQMHPPAANGIQYVQVPVLVHPPPQPQQFQIPYYYGYPHPQEAYQYVPYYYYNWNPGEVYHSQWIQQQQPVVMNMVNPSHQVEEEGLASLEHYQEEEQTDEMSGNEKDNSVGQQQQEPQQEMAQPPIDIINRGHDQEEELPWPPISRLVFSLEVSNPDPKFWKLSWEE